MFRLTEQDKLEIAKLLREQQEQLPFKELLLKYSGIIACVVGMILSYGYLQWQSARNTTDIRELQTDLHTNYVRIEAHRERWAKEDERYGSIKDSLSDMKSDIRDIRSSVLHPNSK